MAETVYLNDGSTEVVLTDKQTFLERLIRERLGGDAARFFLDFISETNEEIANHLRSEREKEMIADGYYRMCHNAVDQFERILPLLDASRLDRARIKALVQEGYDDLYKNL